MFLTYICSLQKKMINQVCLKDRGESPALTSVDLLSRKADQEATLIFTDY